MADKPKLGHLPIPSPKIIVPERMDKKKQRMKIKKELKNND
jgi:hypothetical protein